MTREHYIAEGLRCYQIFIKSIISISDNYLEGQLVKPLDVKCYDGEDAYFVVAADKGTATFSDYANTIAREKRFWLDDAFASGGHNGYDHKKIGITAKGAWQSVCWHFTMLGINPDRDSFTVVGIGDMSGDVFGNGMLLSREICLIAAFDHRHIFIDPKPNKRAALQERKRLFDLSSSSWNDYNKDLISPGGGVFSRDEKYLHLTDEMCSLLGVQEYTMTPNQLIRCILSAEVDLIWNGGIGTYIRATTESNSDVKDMANDGCRVAASDLRARVLAEGGNLGITQLARREYELQGGLINTDFIDNAGGVACSDSEVNIKIALSSMLKAGEMTLDQRNVALSDVQKEVVKMILHNIHMQNFAISADQIQAEANLDVYMRYIACLDRMHVSNPEVDKLPGEKEMMARQASGKTIVRSELAIMCSHAKTLLTRSLIKGRLIDDPYTLLYLYQAFPKEIASKCNESLLKHVLRREITATKISNLCIDDMGVTYIQQMKDDTGCNSETAVKAYFISLEVFQMRPVLNYIADNRGGWEVDKVLMIFKKLRRLMKDASLWIIQNIDLTIEASVKEAADIFAMPIELLAKHISLTVDEDDQEEAASLHAFLVGTGADAHIANTITYSGYLSGMLNIVWGLKDTTGKIDKFAEVYFWIGKNWLISWLREQLDQMTIDSIWSQITKTSMLKDIDRHQRSLAKNVFIALKAYKRSQYTKGYREIVDRYNDEYQDWMNVLEKMQAITKMNFSMFSVALMKLEALSSAIKSECEVIGGI